MCVIAYYTLITRPQIMHRVESIEQETLEVREGEGENKGTRGDAEKTWCVRGECCWVFQSHG